MIKAWEAARCQPRKQTSISEPSADSTGARRASQPIEGDGRRPRLRTGCGRQIDCQPSQKRCVPNGASNVALRRPQPPWRKASCATQEAAGGGEEGSSQFTPRHSRCRGQQHWGQACATRIEPAQSANREKCQATPAYGIRGSARGHRMSPSHTRSDGMSCRPSGATPSSFQKAVLTTLKSAAPCGEQSGTRNASDEVQCSPRRREDGDIFFFPRFFASIRARFRAVPVQQTTGTKPLTIPARKQAHPMREGAEVFRTSQRGRHSERGLAIKVGGVGEGKRQQAGSKGACGSYGEKPRPAGDKSGNTRSALDHGSTARPRPREQADEGGSFGTPATTDFKTEDNQAAPTGVGELREGTLFGPACFGQRCSNGAASQAPGHTRRSKWRDQCRVNAGHWRSPRCGAHHACVPGGSGLALVRVNVWRQHQPHGSCTFERPTLRTPDRGQAATWSPQQVDAHSRIAQEQVAEGSRKRRRSRTRKSAESRASSGATGRTVSNLAAKKPDYQSPLWTDKGSPR